jgi:lipid-binding SYLF domain-containing protein
MRTLITSMLVVICLSLSACSTTPKSQYQIGEQQASVRDMASQTLAQLYQANPGARSAIRKAAGYAVFSNFGMKILFFGGAQGEGIAVNNRTRQETFMKMVQLQPGLGFGANKFRLVFVFDTPEALNQFATSGWEFGANVMAAAKSETEGGAYSGAVSVSPGVHLYQMTEQGAIVGVSITGAKYYKDDELN